MGRTKRKILLTNAIALLSLSIAGVAHAQSFLGPGSQSAGTGQGAVGVDSSYNLAVGTSTTQADTKLLIVGTSTTGAAGSGYFAIKVLDAQRGPLFIVRGDGSVSIGSPYIQTNQSSATGTISGVNPNAPANGALFVHGPIFSTLDIKADGGISVGTTTPQTGGTIYAAGGISTGGALTATTYSGTVSAGNISAGNFGLNTGGGNYTFPASVSIGSSTAPTGGVLYVNGNVGIGTASPGSTLSIVGASSDALTTGQFRVGSTGTPIGFTMGYKDSSYSWIQSWNALPLMINPAGNNTILNRDGGNVGIGTTDTTGYKLSVFGGDIKVLSSAADPRVLIGDSTSAGDYGEFGWTSAGDYIRIGTQAGGVSTMVINESGNVGIGTTGPTARLTVARGSGSYSTGVTNYVMEIVDANNNGNGLGIFASDGTTTKQVFALSYNNVAAGQKKGIFSINDDGTQEIRFDTNGNSYINTGSNVGIGTTNPTSTLTVAGAIKSTTGGFIFPDGTTQTTAGAGSSQWTTSGSDIYYNTGSVGIATSTPAEKLHVIGNAIISGTLTAGTVSGSYSGTMSAANLSSGAFGANTGGGNYSFPASVGIGATSPSGTLHVRATDTTGSIRIGGGNGAGNSRVYIQSNGDNSYIDSYGGDAYQKLRIEASQLLLNSSNGGSVGIGTTGPGRKLQVNNNLASTTANYMLGVFNEGTPTAGMRAGIEFRLGTTAGAKIDTLNDGAGMGDMEFITTDGTTDSVRMHIDATVGNVGIGNTGPGYKLDVSGTGRFTGAVTVGTPVGTGDATTRAYVDNALTAGTTVVSFATTTIATLGGNLNANGYNITAVNKLTVTTIDPVYSIGGVKYATYGADTIGLKTEVYGKAALSSSKSSSYVIDFAAAKPGSDLWLFWQTIDEGKNMKDIVVNLTPEFNGRVWYELNPKNKRIIIFGTMTNDYDNKKSSSSSSLYVSYHLVAPRHDAAQWSNFAPDAEEKGTVLKIK